MKQHDKASLLKAMELKTETVTIDGGEVTIREVPATEYMDIYLCPGAKDDKGEYDGKKFISVLVTHSVLDGKGKRIFTDEDAELIRNGSTSVYQKMVAAVNRVNGLTGGEVKNSKPSR